MRGFNEIGGAVFVWSQTVEEHVVDLERQVARGCCSGELPAWSVRAGVFVARHAAFTKMTAVETARTT